MHIDISVGLAVTERTEGNTKTLMASTGRMYKCLESKTISGRSAFLTSKVI